MEEKEKDLLIGLKDLNDIKTQIIKWLILAIMIITFMFSATICYIITNIYNYEYTDMDNQNININK